MSDIRETSWDHIFGVDTATLSTSESKWIRTVKKLAEDYPNEVQIRHENEDGSIVAHVPADWLKISPRKKRNLSNEQIAELKERLEMARRKKLDETAGKARGGGARCENVSGSANV